jgi:DNA-binding phage protein
MMANFFKTTSCRLIIKTFATFAIILSSNALDSKEIKNNTTTTVSTISETIKNDKSSTVKVNSAVAPHISKTLKNNKTSTSKITPAIAPHISKTLKPKGNSKIKETTKTEVKPGYRMITEVELQNIVEQLPEKDKGIIHEMQNKIANWPDEVFQEVRAYNEFMMLVTNQAKEKYKNLSPSARQALEAESNLKKNLSSTALDTLSTIHVENAY